MSPSSLRAISAAHGALAWASIAAAPAAVWLSLRLAQAQGQGRAPLAARRLALTSAALATALLVATGALGVVLHEPYQRSLRQRVFTQSPRIGWLFERKEHLAFGAVALAVAALAALAANQLRERRRGGAPPDVLTRSLHGAAVRAYATSAILAAASAVLSAIVSHRYHF